MSLTDKARYSRIATLGLLATLIGLIAVQTLAQPLPLGAAAVLALLLALPLALFLPAIRQGRPGSAIWLAMLLMPYFCWAILGTFTPGIAGTLALLRALLIAACFASAMLMVHWQRKAALIAA